ncbi:evolutionarily conserved signaling intermediate in Toll pathway, mitochondrial [Anthonomus grandis grandis]|uniref:evolutionarily conserved signaling intermediate in Toll pathway, mitochondrial n=1 Tax=Anthonomus grandis grandis TaxID=2921223 RepID=UPI00216573F0|nr:evolutionarily conserved signaling intermediate in Toll pathway, mitochondrial [Anthonomus grandis grandis]
MTIKNNLLYVKRKMFIKKLLRQGPQLYKLANQVNKSPRYFNTSSRYFKKNEDDNDQKDKSVMIRDMFSDCKNKNKNTYLQMINIFINQEHVYRRGHVEFIYSALKHMQEFGVERDLEVYRALIDVMPKGKFVPENIIQAEFMHYPKQQQCIIDLLQQMEENHVLPDFDMEDQLVAIFGRRGYPVRRFWRMMYWMPKWRYASPFPLPDPLPSDTYELAKLAIERISNVDPTNQVTIYHTADIKDSVDDTWIIGAQSVTQKRLLSENDPKHPVFVEGPFSVFLRGNYINYFMLRGQARTFDDTIEDADNVENIKNIKGSFFSYKPPIKSIVQVPSVHEQEDGVIYALCATGTSSKDSLLSWIRHLELDGNPVIANLSIVFTLRTASAEIATVEKERERQKQEDPEKIGDS